MLLDLPPELIQLILKHSTCTSYLQAASSCRTLFRIASSSREVILSQLHRTPGVNSGLALLKTEQLFQLLLKRSAEQLYWTRFTATCKVFDFESQIIDARASSLSSSGSYLALVLKGQPTVFRFHVGNGRLSFKGYLEPPPPLHPGAIEVLKTEISEDGGVYVLQRFIPTYAKEDLDAKHPFIMHALRSRPRGSIYLAHYEQHTDQVRMCAFPDNDGYEPLAFAVGNEETFAIAWERGLANELEVVLYTGVEEFTTNETGVVEFMYDSQIIRHEYEVYAEGAVSSELRLVTNIPRGRQVECHHVCSPPPLTGLVFNDSCCELLYYYRAGTLHMFSQRITPSNRIAPNRLQGNLDTVPFAESALPFSIAVPFFGTRHVHEEADLVTCCRKYLTFGMGTFRYPTHGTYGDELWTVACLLVSEVQCQIHNCEHTVDLEGGRDVGNWTVAARLWGLQKPCSSLGCIVAASKGGTRLAVANWDVIYVWALAPDALIEDNADGVYGLFSWSTKTEMIELRPIILQLRAVCFKLRFLGGEDELLAVTDRGVMFWDLSSSGSGERTVHRMDKEIPN